MGGRGSKTAAPQGIELVQAAMQKDAAAVERLLAAGCPPDAGDAEGNSALGAACFSGSREVVEMMLAAQADIDTRTQTAQHAFGASRHPCVHTTHRCPGISGFGM